MTVRMRPRLHGTRVGAAPTRIDVDPGPDFINDRAARQRTEQAVRAGWEAGKSDGEIALQLGATPGHINNVRRQLGLPTVYGPGGRRIDHELAGA